MLLKSVAIALHDLKHDCESSGGNNQSRGGNGLREVTVEESMWVSRVSTAGFRGSRVISLRQLPCPHVKLASVNDAGEFEEDGEPASDPDPVTGSHIHVITGVFL